MSAGIYKITSPSGKVYIGQSVDLRRRIAEHLTYPSNKQPTLYRSICKYGKENHTVEIIKYVDLCDNTNDRLNELEIKYIELYDCIAPKGLNLRTGGNHWKFSDESIEKMRQAKLGTKLTQETKDKLSKIGKGRIRPVEERLNISKGKTGIKLTEEHKRNVSLGKHAEKKPVDQYDLNGVFINSFESMKLAEKILGISSNSISKVCKGVKFYNTAGGFVWKFKNNIIDL